MKCLCVKRQGKTSLSEEAVEGRATEGRGQAKESGTMRIRWAEEVNNENDCVYLIYLDNSCLDDLNPPGDTIIPPLCPLNLLKSSWCPKQCTSIFLLSSKERRNAVVLKFSACLLSDALVISVRSRALWRVCTFKCSYLHALFGVSKCSYTSLGKNHTLLFSPVPFIRRLSKNWVWIPKKSGTEFGKTNISPSMFLTKNCLFF